MKKAKIFFVTAVAIYFGFNLVLPEVVTFVHHLKLQIMVTDEGRGLGGVVVSNGGPLKTDTVVTNDSGLAEIEMIIQKKPSWILPYIGNFNLDKINLNIEAPGYKPIKFILSDRVPSAPLKIKVINLFVEMEKN